MVFFSSAGTIRSSSVRAGTPRDDFFMARLVSMIFLTMQLRASQSSHVWRTQTHENMFRDTLTETKEGMY